MNSLEKRLTDRDINPTAMRILVLRAMMNFGSAFSLGDLEQALDTVDKSTLSRTITLFHAKRLIHSIDDGTGAAKYNVCRDNCMCAPKDMHTHFHCTVCGKTMCIEAQPVPYTNLPDGFSLSSANFVLKGVCADCSTK